MKSTSHSCQAKLKVNVHPTTGHEGPEVVLRYSSTLYLTSALYGVDVQHHAPAALPLGKTRYSLYRRLGGPPGPVWTGAENLAPSTTGIRSPDRQARSESLHHHSCQVLVKIIFSIKIFKKHTNIELHANPSSGSRVFLCGRTDRHDETNSRFSQFCERS